MTNFFIDLWQDLREKRLWPVAVGLLAAMAAVPVVLFKPAGETPLPSSPTATSTVPELLPVVSVDSAPSHGSKLDSFDQKNPFSPIKDLEKKTSTATALAGIPAAPGSSPSGSGTGSPLGSAAGGSGSGGSGGTGGSHLQYYRYTVDVSLGERGKDAQKIEGVKQTQLLPDGNAPVLAYMGLADDARTAVFFIIDPAYTAQGEGKCRPKGEDCRFVYLGVNEDGDEESIFTADGDSEYTLKLLKINREGISPTQAKGDSTDSTPAAKRVSKKSSKSLASKDVPSLLDLPTLLAERR
jgi:hypothetical protein